MKRFLPILAFLLLLAGAIFPAVLGGAGENGEEAHSGLLEWQLLPGDTLKGLASMIYPGDLAMQRRFIKETIKENHAVLDGLAHDQPVYQETTIWLPDLKKLASQITETPKPHLTLHRAVPLSLAPETDTGRDENEIAIMLSKNASLKQAEAELNARISQLQHDLALMQANLARADQPAPPAEKEKPGNQRKIIRRIPDKSVKKATTWVPSELVSPSPLHVLTLLSVALAGSGIVWWRRRKPAISSHAETVVIAPRVVMPSLPEDFFPEESVSVDEVASVVEEAKIFTALGRAEQAIQMLEEYVTASPRASAGPWLLLLEMYRTANRPENFTSTAKRFHQALNVITPQWDSDNVSTVYVARSLEEFPHIMERICSGWGGQDVRDFLDSLIQDNRGGERQGFSIEVLQEILTLLSILEMRDQLTELRPF